MTEALDRLPRGATSISDLSAAHPGCGRARVGVGDAEVRRRRRCAPGHVVVAMLKTPSLQEPARRDFEGIRQDQARRARRRLRQGLRRVAGGGARCERRHAVRRAGGAGRGQRGDAARADGQAGGAQALHRRPHRAGPQRQARPDRRPRRGDPPDHRHPDAAAAEQPDPHRRGGRRQDGGRRRVRVQDRVGRRAAAAAGRRRCARSMSACCRPAPA